jgi:fatty acid desaturase
MTEQTSKEQAENYIFANNVAQSKVFNTFNLYAIAGIGILAAAVGFLIGHADGDMVSEVLAFIQTAFALSGLAFAIWSTETRQHSIENTYLSQCGLLFEIAGLVLSLVALGAHLLSPNVPVVAYLIPWLVYGLSFFVVYQVSRARVGAHERRASKTTSFATLIVIIIIGIFIGNAISASSSGLIDSLSASSQGLLVLGAGSLIAFILGALTAINFFKNLLVKRFDIDLNRLYGRN